MRQLFWSLGAFVAGCGLGPADPAEQAPPGPSAAAYVTIEPATATLSVGRTLSLRFDKLTPGVEMTLRASAPGWAAKEVTVVPTSGGQTALIIAPTRLP